MLPLLVIEGTAGTLGGAPEGGVEIFGVPGIQIRAVMVRAEFQIGYGEAHLQEHGFVESLDFPDLRLQGLLCFARNDKWGDTARLSVHSGGRDGAA